MEDWLNHDTIEGVSPIASSECHASYGIVAGLCIILGCLLIVSIVMNGLLFSMTTGNFTNPSEESVSDMHEARRNGVYKISKYDQNVRNSAAGIVRCSEGNDTVASRRCANVPDKNIDDRSIDLSNHFPSIESANRNGPGQNNPVERYFGGTILHGYGKMRAKLTPFVVNGIQAPNDGQTGNHTNPEYTRNAPRCFRLENTWDHHQAVVDSTQLSSNYGISSPESWSSGDDDLLTDVAAPPTVDNVIPAGSSRRDDPSLFINSETMKQERFSQKRRCALKRSKPATQKNVFLSRLTVGTRDQLKEICSTYRNGVTDDNIQPSPTIYRLQPPNPDSKGSKNLSTDGGESAKDLACRINSQNLEMLSRQQRETLLRKLIKSYEKRQQQQPILIEEAVGRQP